MSPRPRPAAFIALLGGCGPAVGVASGGSSGGNTETSRLETSSSTTASNTDSTDGVTSSGVTPATASSSSGEPPELVEFEGVLRYNADFYKSPIWFETCDGVGISLNLWTEPELRAAPFCGGMYAHVRGTFEPTGHLGSEQLVVREVIEWRTCEVSDCGGDACEPIKCLWECSPFDQECNESEKCVPFSTDGGPVSGSRCVPLPRTPDELGEPCTRDTVTFAGDTCGVDAVCMGGFGDREGVCVELCRGPDNALSCTEGLCVVGPTAGGYCLPSCDPAEGNCGTACVPALDNATYGCIPEPGLPELLEPCDEDGCENDFVCSLTGPTEGLCIPPP